MRVVFWGTPAPAVPALEALLATADVEVAAVVTNPDRPRGRGHRLAPPPVKVVAADAGVAVWQPRRPVEVLDRLAALRPDACPVVAYGSLLPRSVLDAGGAGFVNLHFSLLPSWRGAAPVTQTILAGDERTGVTCFLIEEGMDTGPVLASAATPVKPRETAGELTARLAELGAPVLVEAVRGLVTGALTPVPQDHDRATYAPKVSPADAEVDWGVEAELVERRVRAFNPVPGAHTSLRGQRLKLHRVALADGRGSGGEAAGGPVAGEVVRLEERGPVVACGRGAVVLEVVQPAGKPRMGGADFVNGYRPLGERLGT